MSRLSVDEINGYGVNDSKGDSAKAWANQARRLASKVTGLASEPRNDYLCSGMCV